MILTSGCFDGLHAGHIRFFDAAAALGLNGCRWVAVAVAPDDYIRRMKGREPYWSQEERGDALAGLKRVNLVIHQTGDTPVDAIRHFRPRLFVKGEDWRGRLPTDIVDACMDVGTEIVFVDTPGKHTSEARG